MDTTSMWLALGLYLLGLGHHVLACRCERRSRQLIDRNERCNAAFAEAMALVRYGAHAEAIELLQPFVKTQD